MTWGGIGSSTPGGAERACAVYVLMDCLIMSLWKVPGAAVAEAASAATRRKALTSIVAVDCEELGFVRMGLVG